ncbi:MAG TPA: hypothetical protein VFU08_08640 [Candidatus Udaeobacter sp.]|nr:hypothetical protein [Candidatus Udaeobacter sp.]
MGGALPVLETLFDEGQEHAILLLWAAKSTDVPMTAQVRPCQSDRMFAFIALYIPFHLFFVRL